jgi:hypothetical protein
MTAMMWNAFSHSYMAAPLVPILRDAAFGRSSESDSKR